MKNTGGEISVSFFMAVQISRRALAFIAARRCRVHSLLW